MRLSKPGWISIFPKSKQVVGSGTPTGTKPKNSLLKYAVIVILIAAIALVAKSTYRHYHPATVPIVNADNAIIQLHKNSKDLNDKRTLISVYEERGDYNTALNIAKQVASQTKLYQDYMAVLSICAQNNVPDKSSCLNDTATNLKPLIGNMPFTSAYSAGALLEKNGNKKDAADFYQRAYDTYNPSAGGENMMSRDQLKAHIDELRK